MPNQNVPNSGTTSPDILRRMSQGREYRRIDLHNIEARARENDTDDYIVEGYACTFNQVYRLYDGPYWKVDEQIDPGAFAECDMSDVIVQYDHAGRVFARTKNSTLELRIDSHGLHCRINLGGTEIGRQLYEEIKGGYTDKMSFGFIVAEDQRTETEDHEKGTITVLRTITKIKKLFDVSAVSLPANDATEISARGFCDGLIAELEEESRKARQQKNTTNTLKLLLEVNK